MADRLREYAARNHFNESSTAQHQSDHKRERHLDSGSEQKFHGNRSATLAANSILTGRPPLEMSCDSQLNRQQRSRLSMGFDLEHVESAIPKSFDDMQVPSPRRGSRPSLRPLAREDSDVPSPRRHVIAAGIVELLKPSDRRNSVESAERIQAMMDHINKKASKKDDNTSEASELRKPFQDRLKSLARTALKNHLNRVHKMAVDRIQQSTDVREEASAIRHKVDIMEHRYEETTSQTHKMSLDLSCLSSDIEQLLEKSKSIQSYTVREPSTPKQTTKGEAISGEATRPKAELRRKPSIFDPDTVRMLARGARGYHTHR